jgi:hypothetical protein
MCGIEYQSPDKKCSRYFTPHISERCWEKEESSWTEITKNWPSHSSLFKCRGDYCSVIILDIECRDGHREDVSFCSCLFNDQDRNDNGLCDQLELLMSKLKNTVIEDRKQLNATVADMVSILIMIFDIHLFLLKKSITYNSKIYLVLLIRYFLYYFRPSAGHFSMFLVILVLLHSSVCMVKL